MDAGVTPGGRQTRWLLAAGGGLLVTSLLEAVRPLGYVMAFGIYEDFRVSVTVRGEQKLASELTAADRVHVYAVELARSAWITVALGVVVAACIVLARPRTRRHVWVARATLLVTESWLLFLLCACVATLIGGDIREVGEGQPRFWAVVDRYGSAGANVVVAFVGVALSILAFGVVDPRRPKVVTAREPSPVVSLDDSELPSYVG